MKYLIIIILSSFIVSLAHADKYQITSAGDSDSKVWVVNTKTGQVKICDDHRNMFYDPPTCSKWSDKD